MNLSFSSGNESKKYDAFISYSHAADGRLAPSLQRAIHRFAKPWYRLRAVRTFRDQTNLSVNPHLWDSIELALSDSSFLLLFASPKAANSKWVMKEVDFWLNSRSPDTILIVLTDGELIWNETINDFDSEKTDSLPLNLFGVFKQEPLYVDLRWARTDNDLSLHHTKFREAVGKIAASLRKIDLDLLFGEDVRQHRITRLMVAIAVIILLSLTIYSYVSTIKERQAKIEAQSNLAKIYLKQGRQELVNFSPLQALVFITEAYRAAPFLPATKYMLSQAMRVTKNQKILYVNSTGLQKALLSEINGRVLFLTKDHVLEVWDWIKKYRLSSIPGNFDEKDYFTLTKGGRHVITAKYKGILQIWDAEKGTIIFEPNEQGMHITKATCDPLGNRLLAIDEGYVVWLWDLQSKKLIKKIDYNVWDADFSPNGEYLVTGSGNGFLGVWNALDGNGIIFLESPKDPKQKAQIWNFVKFAYDINRVIASTENETIILDLAKDPKNSTFRRLIGHTNIHNGEFSSDGKWAATVSYDGTTAVWELETAKLFAILDSHHKKENSGGSAYFSQDGKKLITLANGPRTPKVWNLETKKLITSIDGPRGWVLAICFASNNENIITVDTHGALRSWSFGADDQVAIENSIGELQAAAFNYDATRIAIGGSLGTAVVDLFNGGIIDRIVEESKVLRISGFDFSPDGQKILIGRIGSKLKLWNLSNSYLNALGKASIGTFYGAFSPDGKSYATVDLDLNLRVWHGDKDEPHLVLNLEGVSAVSFSPDSHEIVFASKKEIKVFNIESKSNKLRLKAVDEDCVKFTFSPDGSKIAASGRNGNSYVWDTSSGDLAFILRGHESVVRDIRYSRDGYNIITASMDGTVRIWDAFTGDLLALLNGGVGPILAVTEANDKSTILAISQSGKIQRWVKTENNLDLDFIAESLECHNPWTIDAGSIVFRVSIPSKCVEGKVGP